MCFFLFSPSSVFPRIKFHLVVGVGEIAFIEYIQCKQMVDIVFFSSRSAKYKTKLKKKHKTTNSERRRKRDALALTHAHTDWTKKWSAVYFVLAQTLNGRISPEF